MSNLQEFLAIPQFHLRLQAQFLHQGAQGTGGQPGHETQAGRGHGLQMELTAHAPIKDEGGLLDREATAQGVQESLQGLGIVAIAPQDRHVKGQPFGVRRHRHDDLRPIAAMIATVPVSSQVFGPVAFELDTGQIIEHQPDRLGKGTLIKLLF